MPLLIMIVSVEKVGVGVGPWGTTVTARLFLINDATRFAQWSLETDKPIIELMADWMIEEDQQESHMQGRDIFFLEGMLPCGHYGGMDCTGRTHT